MRKEHENLYQRLDILEQAGLIEKRVAEQTDIIIQLIYAGETEIDMEKMEMFTTHIAMAMQRILNGTEENPLAQETLEALQEEAVYEGAVKLAEKIYEAVSVDFPDVEREYLTVHLCNLLN